jgi:hypothetical protein
VEKIETGAFEDCISLLSIALPSRLEVIEARAFAGCIRLVEISLPESLKVLGREAFASCAALETVLLPDGRVKLEKGVFSECENLETLVVSDSDPILRPRRAFLGITPDANVVPYSELARAALIAELTDPALSDERRTEIEAALEE